MDKISQIQTKDFPSVTAARKAAYSQLEFYRTMQDGPSTMKKVKGDLLALADQGQFDVIVQGCNCFNTMGSGIARSIKEKYPNAYVADCSTRQGDYNKLGNYTCAQVGNLYVVNAYTQFGFNAPNSVEDVFEYTALAMILQKLAQEWPNARFGFPKIGCGLAGGDEFRIMSMIEDFSRKIGLSGGSVTVVEFE
jgi:O-acetyl-ADP-ribose deacetylase (regulator of RNase III)